MRIRMVFPIGAVLLIATRAANFQTHSLAHVNRLDPGLDAIASPEARVEEVASGLGFTEGPVWSRSGSLLFTDINAAVINKWTPGGKVVRFLGPTEFTHNNAAVAGVPGANGLTLDKQGRLVICDQGNRVISRLEKDGKVAVLADRYEGKRFNSPNDLVFKLNGSLYFTDPPYGLAKEDNDPKKEQTVNGVYRLVEGKVELLVKNLTRPNGLAFSPDEKYLYVSNSEPLKRYMRYGVDPEGFLGAGEVFFDMTASTEPGLPDGMKVDRQGNLYAAGPGGVLILSPEGKHLGTIKVPEVAANCAWGDNDAQTLYITATSSVYRVRLKVPGIRP